MLPSARPLTTSWPMQGSVSALFDRAGQFGSLALVAIDAERVREVARFVGLVADQHALKIFGGGERIADRSLVAADFLDDRFQHVHRVVIRPREILSLYPSFFP